MRDRLQAEAFRWGSDAIALGVALFFCLPPESTGARILGSRTKAPDGPAKAGRGFLPLLWDDPINVPPPTGPKDWPMAGANPQRTSWNAEEVRGGLRPALYRPIQPYILAHVQVIAAEGLLYVSTTRGLYVMDAETGNIAWVYPTEMPQRVQHLRLRRLESSELEVDSSDVQCAFGASYNEATILRLYDYDALFKANAYVLAKRSSELVKYLDVSAFERGDLFDIQYLVSLLEERKSKEGPSARH